MVGFLKDYLAGKIELSLGVRYDSAIYSCTICTWDDVLLNGCEGRTGYFLASNNRNVARNNRVVYAEEYYVRVYSPGPLYEYYLCIPYDPPSTDAVLIYHGDRSDVMNDPLLQDVLIQE